MHQHSYFFRRPRRIFDPYFFVHRRAMSGCFIHMNFRCFTDLKGIVNIPIQLLEHGRRSAL